MNRDEFTVAGFTYTKHEFPELFPPPEPLPTTHVVTPIDEVVRAPLHTYNWFTSKGRFTQSLPYMMETDDGNTHKLGDDVWKSIAHQHVRVVGEITEKACLRINELHVIVDGTLTVWRRRLLTEEEKDEMLREMERRKKRSGQDIQVKMKDTSEV